MEETRKKLGTAITSSPPNAALLIGLRLVVSRCTSRHFDCSDIFVFPQCHRYPLWYSVEVLRKLTADNTARLYKSRSQGMRTSVFEGSFAHRSSRPSRHGRLSAPSRAISAIKHIHGTRNTKHISPPTTINIASGSRTSNSSRVTPMPQRRPGVQSGKQMQKLA